MNYRSSGIKRLSSLGVSRNRNQSNVLLIAKGRQKRKSDCNRPSRRDQEYNTLAHLPPILDVVPTFGSSLQDILTYERKTHPEIVVPTIIEKSISYLMNGLSVEGIFRIPGENGLVEALKTAFNKGHTDYIDFYSRKPPVTVADVASLLKLYLRQLPEPLLTKNLEAQFIFLLNITEDKKRIDRYKELIQQLPEVNNQVIKKLLFLLHQVNINSYSNKMDTQNISVVFGFMAGIFATGPRAGEFVAWLIDNYFTLYEQEDLQKTVKPLLLRKIARHTKTITTLLDYNDHIWSFDTSGLVFVWNAISFELYKSFDTKLQQLYTPPLIFNGRLCCVSPKCLKTWPIATILDKMSNSKDITESEKVVELDLKIITRIEVANEELWVTGDKTVIVSKDFTLLKQLESIELNIAQNMHCIGDQVWILRDKIFEIWDKNDRILLTEIDRSSLLREGSKISYITTIGSYVWLLGRHRNLGAAWIIDPASLTLVKEVGCNDSQAKGTLYQACQVGPLIWIVSWDKKILALNSETFQFICNIPNLHCDAIECIIVRKCDNGWNVWTASTDRTIEVLFVPEYYAEHLTPVDSEGIVSDSNLNSSGIDTPPPRAEKNEIESTPTKYKSKRSLTPRNNKSNSKSSPRAILSEPSPVGSDKIIHTPSVPLIHRSHSGDYERQKKSISPRGGSETKPRVHPVKRSPRHDKNISPKKSLPVPNSLSMEQIPTIRKKRKKSNKSSKNKNTIEEEIPQPVNGELKDSNNDTKQDS